MNKWAVLHTSNPFGHHSAPPISVQNCPLAKKRKQEEAESQQDLPTPKRKPQPLALALDEGYGVDSAGSDEEGKEDPSPKQEAASEEEEHKKEEEEEVTKKEEDGGGLPTHELTEGNATLASTALAKKVI